MKTSLYREKYYQALLKEFPTKQEISSEIINLEAILNLPKGTEYFISDIHGEFKGFQHIINTGSGIIREKIYECFGSQKTNEECEQLVRLISYPVEMMQIKKSQTTPSEFEIWTMEIIANLVQFIVFCSSKYSRSKLRKKLPPKYVYLGEELIYASLAKKTKRTYIDKILEDIVELNIAEDVIKEFSCTIKFLVIDHMHIVGDIFDRGTDAYDVLNFLMDFPSIDIQWGNHDVLWLGAFSGSEACLMTLLRIATKYGYLLELEKQYGLNLRSLFQFSEENYQLLSLFIPHSDNKTAHSNSLSKVHQALLILQLKLEGLIILRNPEFKMNNRLFLEKLEEIKHSLSENCFQLVNASDPFKLTRSERQVVTDLMCSFQKSTRLDKQLNFLIEKGSLYLKYNQNLIFHGCIPLSKKGEFQWFITPELYGKSLMDFFEDQIRKAFDFRHNPDESALDLVWYCWCGKYSPLFGREEMKTFESYFMRSDEEKKETNNAYFQLRNQDEICDKILREFGIDGEHSCIVNGHTPVIAKKGESPIKANGKLFVIDGGLSRPYQCKTGIAGYTLLNNSYGFQIVTHTPFESINKFIHSHSGDSTLTKVINRDLPRKTIEETTIGEQIKVQVNELKDLLQYL